MDVAVEMEIETKETSSNIENIIVDPESTIEEEMKVENTINILSTFCMPLEILFSEPTII